MGVNDLYVCDMVELSTHVFLKSKDKKRDKKKEKPDLNTSLKENLIGGSGKSKNPYLKVEVTRKTKMGFHVEHRKSLKSDKKNVMFSPDTKGEKEESSKRHKKHKQKDKENIKEDKKLDKKKEKLKRPSDSTPHKKEKPSPPKKIKNLLSSDSEEEFECMKNAKKQNDKLEEIKETEKITDQSINPTSPI